MIDLKDLRENPEKYRRGAQLKGVSVDIDAILRLETERVAAQREFEQFRSQQNEATKDIGKLKDPQAKKDAIARMGEVKEKVKAADEDLHQAVLRLALDMMTHEKGFTQLTVPVLVRETAMRGTGFFPAGREQAYRVGEPTETGEDERFLTGTAEVGLTAFHMNETLDEAALPKKYTAVSTCFRREAGTYGKDTS